MPISVITPDLVTEIASAYPGLQSLNLSSNEIRVVENLEPLVALESLDLRQNSIHTLDGVGQLPALKQLDVSGNRIQRCARCHGPLLEELNLADNQLSDWSQLESIGWGFPQLRRLQLTGNPICEDADYRLRVAQLVPTLDQLDGTDLAEVMGAGGSAARATRSMRPVAAAAAVPPPAEVAIADTPGPETGNGEATTDATNIELIQRLRDTVASLEADSNKMLQSLQDAEAQGDEAEERATDAMVRHTELESENEQLRREVDTCGVEKLKLESALRETTNKMQLCAAETQAVQQVLADTERDSLRYREEQQRLTDSAEQLRHELALARRAAEDLAETNATLKQQLQQTRQQQQQQQLATGDVSTKQRLQQLQDTHQNTLAYVAELEQKVGSIAEAQQSAQAAAEQAATAAAAEIQSLNAACRQLQINHEQDKDRSLVLEDTINMLQRRLREVSEQSVHVHADLQTTQESLEQAQAALVKSRDHAIQTVGLHDENLMLRQQLEEAKTRAVQIEDTLEFTRQSLIDAEHALEKTKDHVKLCGELEHENSRLRSNLSEVQTSLEHAHGGMAQLRESCDKSQRQLIESEKRTEEQLAVLSEQLAVAKERAALAAAQQQGSVSQVAVESQREKQSHAATMKQLEAAVAELACQKEVVAQRTSIVAATTTDLEAVLSDLHAELSNLQKENHSLRTQLTESNRRGEALSDVQEQKLLLQSKLKHAQDSAQINGIVQASQKSLREAEESFRQVIEESLPSAALKAEHSTLKKENVQLHNELVDLRAQLAEAHAKAGAIGSVLDTTTASLRAAEQSLCDSRASATALFELQQENQSLKSQLEAGAQDYKSTQQLIEENQQLQQKLYGHEKACHEAERQVFALQQQNEAAIDEQNGLRDQLQHATNISIEVQTVLDTTKHSLDSAEKALLQSKEQSLKLQDQLGQAQEALGQSHKQCDDLNLQLQAANASAGQRKNQLQSLESSRTRDQAELKQLRVHVANSAELQAKVANYSTRSTDVANSEAGDYTRLVEEISLLNIQVESMGHVLRLLEEELASHGALVGDHAKKVAVEQLLSKWRDKVLSLLVQQKSADVAHQQTIATMEQQWMQGQAEVAHLTTSVKVLKQTEVTLRAEIERANNRAQHAEASLKDGTRVRESAAANLEKEKINIQHLAAVLRTKLEEIQAMEQRLQSAACVIHGYGDRVQFAVGRITMMQGVLATRELQASRLSKPEESAAPLQNCAAQTSAEDFESQLPSLSGLETPAERAIIFHQKQEISRLTSERDYLIRTSLNRERNEQSRTSTDREELQAEIESLRAESDLAQAHARQIDVELQDARSAIVQAQQEVSTVRQRCAIDAEKTRSMASAKCEEMEKNCATEVGATRRELQRVKREHSKSLVSLRTVERKLARLEQEDAIECNERERQLVEKLRNRESQLKALRAERSTLLSTLREQRAAVGRGTTAGGLAAVVPDRSYKHSLDRCGIDSAMQQNGDICGLEGHGDGDDDNAADDDLLSQNWSDSSVSDSVSDEDCTHVHFARHPSSLTDSASDSDSSSDDLHTLGRNAWPSYMRHRSSSLQQRLDGLAADFAAELS